ncbi:NUDIX domain-containing protein [Candidatus Woesearchaeota archaeon]|nr:NUDIX domain-containing protein [Candidatus Woesearchaeota archaeon]
MVVVVAAWVFHEGRLLLVQHRRLHRWLPVGGHVGLGEHVLDALRREVHEEVGLYADVMGSPPLVGNTERSEELPLPFRVSSHAGPDGEELVLDFVAVADDVSRFSLREEELVDYQWFSLEGLRSSKVVDGRVKVFGERAFAYLKEVVDDGKAA